MNNFKTGNMKRQTIICITLLSLLPITESIGQNANLERFSTYKIGFFTKKLNLSPDEAEKFWPVYNDFEKKRNQIRRDKIMLVRDFNQNESILTNKQLTEMGDKLAGYISEESNLAISFHNRIREILPPAKVIRYYQAENQYKIMLLKELQQNRQQFRGNQELDF
jgi:hypothetical protein